MIKFFGSEGVVCMGMLRHQTLNGRFSSCSPPLEEIFLQVRPLRRKLSCNESGETKRRSRICKIAHTIRGVCLLSFMQDKRGKIRNELPGGCTNFYPWLKKGREKCTPCKRHQIVFNQDVPQLSSFTSRREWKFSQPLSWLLLRAYLGERISFELHPHEPGPVNCFWDKLVKCISIIKAREIGVSVALLSTGLGEDLAFIAEFFSTIIRIRFYRFFKEIWAWLYVTASYWVNWER